MRHSNVQLILFGSPQNKHCLCSPTSYTQQHKDTIHWRPEALPTWWTHQDAGEQGGRCQIWTQSQRMSASPPQMLILHRRLHEEWVTERLRRFLHLSGWQAARQASPACCISQSVRPQFLASKCLDKHHRNNKKDLLMSISTQNVFFFFFCLSVVGSCLFF